MEIVFRLIIGMQLSAASGLRLFIPLAGIALAHSIGHTPLAKPFVWLGEPWALAIVIIGAIVEVLGFYAPQCNSWLDIPAFPGAWVSGVLCTASQLEGLPPWGRWLLAFSLGGTAALIVQSLTTLLRAQSTTLTGGIENPRLATIELGASLGITLWAFLIPSFTIVPVLLGLGLSGRYLYQHHRCRAASSMG